MSQYRLVGGLAVGAALVIAVATYNKSSSINPKATVMITNLLRSSGGSGTILASSESGSQILTNSHVCSVVQNGGFVTDYSNHKYFIIGYKKSNFHDLCLVFIKENLEINTKIASSAPKKGQTAIVYGHPHLLPTVRTDGYFSDKMPVQVLVGFRDCTQEELDNPMLNMICTLAGGLPLIRTYDSEVTSALIQPGSSGSAVYNAEGEISAVIFAGSGDLGFGLAVPYEYVYSFVTQEAKTLFVESINNVVNFAANRESSERHKSTEKKVSKLVALCALPEFQNGYLTDLCDSLKEYSTTDSVLYNK